MTISDLRKMQLQIVVHGLHVGVIQSILDYDHLLGRKTPSIAAIIARGRRKERFFWGGNEVELPVFATLSDLPTDIKDSTSALVNVQSARNVKTSTTEALNDLKNLRVATIFAENTPEQHSLELIKLAKEKNVLLIGPSSVGMVIPAVMKLGAIGGTTYQQLIEAHIQDAGDVAIITTSGGMVNELIRVVTSRGRAISFAIAMGGDRFPILDPSEAMLLAEKDAATKQIVYFGELGGSDEYKIVELIKQGKIKKKIIAYIAGVAAELFDEPPQFGHAKALAQTYDESATAKKQMLAKGGVTVANRFDDIGKALGKVKVVATTLPDKDIVGRKKAYFMSHLSGDVDGNVQLLGKELLTTVQKNTIASLTLSILLGHQVESNKLVEFVDFVLKLLVDHSPNVSGAVNTIIATRAGKDLVSSLTAGLLTIGPRFGGAVNAAAEAWLKGVQDGLSAKQLNDIYTASLGVVPGIGHKKYRLDNPDPRVEALLEFANRGGEYLKFAQDVESFTTLKKSNLILNVDGTIAAIMLDLMVSELHYTPKQLEELISIEFFNSFFVISRTIGFTGHYLDQRRHDEGLFRLEDDDLSYFTE